MFADYAISCDYDGNEPIWQLIQPTSTILCKQDGPFLYNHNRGRQAHQTRQNVILGLRIFRNLGETFDVTRCYMRNQKNQNSVMSCLKKYTFMINIFTYTTIWSISKIILKNKSFTWIVILYFCYFSFTESLIIKI